MDKKSNSKLNKLTIVNDKLIAKQAKEIKDLFDRVLKLEVKFAKFSK